MLLTAFPRASVIMSVVSEMERDGRETRRGWLGRWLGAAVALPLAGAVVAVLRRERDAAAPERVPIPADVPVGLSIVDGAVVHRSEGGAVHAFSARCTHLGCRVDRVIGDEAVCPCHGSRYRADGTVARGPAPRPLTPLRVEADPKTGGWIAHAS